MHLEILSDAQKKILSLLARATRDNSSLYLAGGTALSLQLGHRLSVDFDFFAPRLGDPETIFRSLQEAGAEYTVISISYETVYLSIASVQVSFIGYDYPMLDSFTIWEEHRINLASLDDIACMKLSAITSRGSKKDFFDLHHLIVNFRTLEEYLRLFVKKYQARDIGHVVRSLVYFADADNEPDLKMLIHTPWKKVKSDFEAWVKGI